MKEESRDQRMRFSGFHVPILILLSLCSMFVVIYGCSPPDDYYGQVLEMESYGEQSRGDTGRSPGEIVSPAKNSEPIIVAESPVYQLTSEGLQEQAEAESPIEQEENQGTTQGSLEEPPRREVVQESPPEGLPPEPIAIAADVIKIALNNANLGVSVRNVELANGRLTGGKNSVRVNFFSESVNVIDEKFVAICAVLYHLNKEANTVDVVVGIAEDEQANLLAVLQSDVVDISAWMTNEISRAEWYSRVTKKIL